MHELSAIYVMLQSANVAMLTDGDLYMKPFDSE